jgi:hypothetical protein
MKFCRVSLFFALLIAVCLPAVAQTGMRANIPFNFVAAGQSLPAGQYVVAPVFKDGHTAWRIYSDNANVHLLTSPVESQKAHNPSLVFFQAGGVYSLVEFWPSEHSGRGVPKSNVKQTLVSENGKYVEIAAK